MPGLSTNPPRPRSEGERRHRVEFVVEGEGKFPFDMLRYDSCFPKTILGASRMEDGGRRRVALVRYARTLEGYYVGPSDARWKSFGWSVVGFIHGDWRDSEDNEEIY